MRFHSTPQSALNLEITKLAIIETIVAIALYVSAGLYLGTFKYLAWAVIVAPFMLFRTESSANWGLKVYERFGRRIFALPELPRVIILIFAPLVGMAIRIIATLYWTIRRPIYTLKEMPQNWLRQSICTDIRHAPEILPLEALRGKDKQIPSFASLIKALRFQPTFAKQLLLVPSR